MNKLLATAIVSTAALVSFGAAAQEVTPTPELNAPSTLSRAEVRAELARAKAAGELKVFSSTYVPTVATTRTRAEVVAELRQAKADGEYALLNGEAVSPIADQQYLAKKKEDTRLATNPQASTVR